MKRLHLIFKHAGLVCLALTLLLTVALPSCRNGHAPVQEGVRLTDALGREVTLPASPTRVAALLGSLADVWCLAGGTLCAAAEDAWEDFGLELEGAVNLGGAHSPSTERLIAASPDLVLASASTASNVELCGLLESMRITVVYFDIDCFDDYLEMLRICTEVTGRDDLYAENGQRLKEEIDGIRGAWTAYATDAQERRILLLRASSTSVKAKGSEGTILGEMLADMGCINIADSDTSLLENLSLEAILRENPHRVFVVTMGKNTDKAIQSLENLIKENPAWSTLDAIEEGRMHVMDKRLFNLKPNARFAEAYRILYEILIQK